VTLSSLGSTVGPAARATFGIASATAAAAAIEAARSFRMVLPLPADGGTLAPVYPTHITMADNVHGAWSDAA
jgi:hypothetical protein